MPVDGATHRFEVFSPRHESHREDELDIPNPSNTIRSGRMFTQKTSGDVSPRTEVSLILPLGCMGTRLMDRIRMQAFLDTMQSDWDRIPRGTDPAEYTDLDAFLAANRGFWIFGAGSFGPLPEDPRGKINAMWPGEIKLPSGKPKLALFERPRQGIKKP